MNGIEIALLIAGGAIFIVSFLLPGGKGKRETSEDAAGMTEDQIKFMVEKEIDEAKQHVGEIVDETISYAMEKAERSMDRITNEKMLAINEYSDTVLGEINKNHQEAVFLYDMLNDKHETLKSTVSQAAITVSEVQQKVRDTELTIKELAAKSVIEQLVKEEDIQQEENPVEPQEMEFKPFQFQGIENVPAEKEAVKSPRRVKASASKAETVEDEEVNSRDMGIHFKENSTLSRNSNERILELHKAGKSNMAIAKELNLGIGEVKLVIDLFEGAS